jgi:hypothetical protein
MECRSQVRAWHFTLIAIRLQLLIASRIECERGDGDSGFKLCVFDSHAKQIAPQKNVAIRLDFVKTLSLSDQFRTFIPQQLQSLVKGQ